MIRVAAIVIAAFALLAGACQHDRPPTSTTVPETTTTSTSSTSSTTSSTSSTSSTTTTTTNAPEPPANAFGPCIPDGAGPHPVVVYNHGGLGNAIGGDPEGTCEALAEAGYVGYSPMRRLTTSLAGHIDDVYTGLDYVLSLESVDADRVGMLGYSRGGLLTLQAVTERSDIDAAVLMAPAPGNGFVYDVLDDAADITADVLVMVAANDNTNRHDLVALAQTVYDTLFAAGVAVEIEIYPPFGNDGHQLFATVGEYWPDVVAFLDTQLGS